MPDPRPGMRFAVTEEMLFEKDGKIVANYRPEFNPYVVTETNAAFVGEKINERKAGIVSYGPPRLRAGGFAETG